MGLKTVSNKALLYLSYILRLDKSLGQPVIKLIEPTNACMMDCIMCPRKNMKRKIEFMKLDFFKHIIDQAKWNDNLWIHHFGDPLMHPKIIEMIDYAAKKEIKPRISVNPNLLSEKMCERLINSRLHTIMISLDGLDDKTYKYIRGVNADYKKAVDNINTLIRLKNEKCSKLRIVLHMVRMKINKNDSEKFKKLWNKNGVDEICVPDIDVIDVSDKKIIEQGDDELFSKGFKDKENTSCAEPWTGVVINASGTVVPCCFDYDEKYVVGDLKKESLKKIWNNKKMRLVRKQVKNKTLYKNPLCKNCYERNDYVLLKQFNYFFKILSERLRGEND